MAPLTNYIVGDAPRLTGTFKNSAGTASDPTGITFKIKEPDGASTAAFSRARAARLLNSRTAQALYWSLPREALPLAAASRSGVL